MPEGIEVVVDGGFAVIDFVDRTKAGPGLNRLLKVGGAGVIEPLTREHLAPRRKYRVPEGNAREAGLLDVPGAGDIPAERPSLLWSRNQLDTQAREIGIDPAPLPNKQAVLEAIETIANR